MKRNTPILPVVPFGAWKIVLNLNIAIVIFGILFIHLSKDTIENIYPQYLFLFDNIYIHLIYITLICGLIGSTLLILEINARNKNKQGVI